MTEYKEQYRGLKASMTDKDKQLDLAKRTIERLSGHCNAMEVSQHLMLSLNPTFELPCLPHLTHAPGLSFIIQVYNVCPVMHDYSLHQSLPVTLQSAAAVLLHNIGKGSCLPLISNLGLFVLAALDQGVRICAVVDRLQ